MTKIIDPLKTRRMVSDGEVQAPVIKNNIDGLAEVVGSGLSTFAKLKERQEKVANTQKQNLLNKYKLEVEKSMYNHTEKLLTDKDYRYDKKLHSLEMGKAEGLKENFLKTWKEQGFEESEIEQQLFDIDKIVKDTDINFKKSYLSMLEKKEEEENKRIREAQKINYFLSTDGKREQARFHMASGNEDIATSYFNDFANSIVHGVKEGLVNPNTATEDIRIARGNIIEGAAISIADNLKGTTEIEQLKELNNIYNWSFDEFSKKFDNFNYRKDGIDISLNDDDYFKFRTKIKQQKEYIKIKSNADKEKLKWEEIEKLNEIKNNPVKSAYKQGGYIAGTPTTSIINEVALNSTNNKFGTSYKSLDELVYSDIPIVTIQKGYNDKLSIYNDPQIESINLIKTRLEEKYEFVGGHNKEIQNRIMNDQYSFEDSPFVPSNQELELYQENDGYNKVFDRLYSPGNKEFLLSTSKANIKENIDILLDNFTIEKSRVGFQDNMYSGVNSNTRTALGSTLSAFRENSQYDRNQKFILENITQRTADLIKINVLNETNGILDEDVAKKLKLDKKIGVPISDLSPGDQSKIFNYYMENPSKELKQEVNQIIEYFTKDYKTVDTGYGMINIDKVDYNDNIGKNIANIIATTEFYNDKEQLIPQKRVTPVYFNDMKTLTFAYRGQKVYIKNNGELIPYTYKIGG